MNTAGVIHMEGKVKESELIGKIRRVQRHMAKIRDMSAAEQRKNDLIMYLAHDLKTPLASVIGYLNLLRDEEKISDELREKYLSVSLDKAERLEDLINEFFEIQPMLNEKNLKCNFHVPENIIMRCDVDRMQRVFDNLLRNAVIYSFNGTDINITVTRQEENVMISFTNHGDTIPAEKLERIFEQFYRLDASRSTSSGGAGLGLAIAKQIVGLPHGTIQARFDSLFSMDSIIYLVKTTAVWAVIASKERQWHSLLSLR